MALKCQCGNEISFENNYECKDCKEFDSWFDEYASSMRNIDKNEIKEQDEVLEVIAGNTVEITPTLPKVWIE